VTAYSAPGPDPDSQRARVVLVRTSEPPWRSVIAIPQRAPVFRDAGIARSSYASDVKRGTHSGPSAAASRSGVAANVIDTGQAWPAST